MMKTARLYSILAPAPERFDDKGDTPLTVVPVERTTGKVWEAAILGTSSAIQAVRITIPGVENEIIDPEDFKSALKFRMFILDCIRINYDSDAEYFRLQDNIPILWNFLEPEKPPQFSVRLKDFLNPEYRINSLGLGFLISAPPNIRPLVHLLADGNDPRLPIQFRFLSYYKIIEMHYRVTSNTKFNKFAESFVPDFRKIYSDTIAVRSLCKRLTILRDKCAHIKLSSGDLGFSHIQAKNDDLLNSLDILRRMAIHAININYPNSTLQFSETRQQAEIKFAEMEAAGLKPVRVAGP
jgi:hypothetical protein